MLDRLLYTKSLSNFLSWKLHQGETVMPQSNIRDDDAEDPNVYCEEKDARQPESWHKS